MPRKSKVETVIDKAIIVDENPTVLEDTTSEEMPSPAPSQADPEWQPYVLSFLNPQTDFDDQGNPFADTLRPLVIRLCGDIIETYPVQIFPPHKDNNFTATVAYRIAIDFSRGERTDVRIFGDTADINGTNSGKFAQFSVATATTRAKGRCYKEALGLRKVYVAEEMTDIPAHEAVSGLITLPQRKLIDKLCRENDINLMTFVNAGSKTQYSNLKEVGYDKAHQLIDKLNGYQQAPDRIPVSLRGYDPNWLQNERSA